MEQPLVYVRVGSRTQTVNICDANNRRGQYDWIIRLPRDVVTPNEVPERETGGTPALIEWLKAQGGEVEKCPPPEAPAAPANRIVDVDWRGYAPGQDEWLQDVRQILEREIDRLLSEFLQSPYAHRVEHSLHCQLFSALIGHAKLREPLRFCRGEGTTQPVHKEWPETVPRELCRRGNFDLSILAPDLVRRFTREEFREGRIPAPLVVEVGLDYGWSHLENDHEKLTNSRVPYGYLIHLERERQVHERVTRAVEGVDGWQIRAAYGLAVADQRWHKPLSVRTIWHVASTGSSGRRVTAPDDAAAVATATASAAVAGEEEQC